MAFENPDARRPDLVLSMAGIVAIAAGAVLLLLLQLVPPTNEINPLRRTISEYALSSNKWIFDVAVALVALGSVLGLLTLVRRGVLKIFSGASLFSTLWIVGLLVVIAYPKNNWAIGPSVSGTVHRVASLVAFICLPIAVLLMSRIVGSSRHRRVSRWLALVSFAWFGVILTAVVVASITDGRWWEMIPLGLVERLLALSEVFALGTLFLSVRAAEPLTAEPTPEPELASAEA